MSRTLGQRRASFCLKQLEDLKCKRDEFKNFSSGLPAMIMQNGFGQTLAFLAAKASETKTEKENGKSNKRIRFKEKDKHYEAFRIISAWLKKEKILPDTASEVEFLREISRMDQHQYLRAQQECLAMLEWLKRYANAALFRGVD